MKKMASIRQLNTKHWQVQIRRLGLKPIRKTFINKDTAIKWANIIESEIDRGIYLNRDEAERITFSELIKRYSKEVTPLKKSSDRELSRLKKLDHFFGPYTLARLQSSMVAEYRDRRLSEGLSGATVVKDLNTLSHIIDTAIKEWDCHIPINPVKNIRRPRLNPSRTRRLYPQEEQILLVACREHSLMMEAIVLFAIETAMRLSEMIHLEWSDIDLSQSTATLHTTKNGEVRHVPLSRKAKELLNKLPRHIESQKIFWRWLTASGFEASWQRVVKKSNLVDFRFHDLRHEATSRLFEKGLSMMEVSLITGHKTLQMLKRYTHLDAQDIAQKLNYK